MSETPETDKLWARNRSSESLLAHARAKERQRNRWRSVAEQAEKALRQYADSTNWMREGIFDPSGMNFEGIGVAESAISEIQKIIKP